MFDELLSRHGLSLERLLETRQKAREMLEALKEMAAA